ncbi:MAG: hypothetical protein NVS3B26_16740 [Mycobacteriales bacterium]
MNGRVGGVLVTDGADLAGVAALRAALNKGGAALQLIGPRGSVKGQGKRSVRADTTLFAVDSVTKDALVVWDGPAPLHPKSSVMLQEAYQLYKPVAACGADVQAGVDAGVDPKASAVVTGNAV